MSDDIQRFHDLMGDDEEPVAPVVRKHYAGIDPTPLSIPAPNGLDLPSSNPVQWKQFEQQWGYLPYETPIQEYLCNTYALNERTLRYRWEGIGITQQPGKPPVNELARMIGEIFYGPKELDYKAERARVQSARARQMDLPDYMSQEEIETNRKIQINATLEQMRDIEDKLAKGYEIVVEAYYDPAKGMDYKEMLRPLSSIGRSRLQISHQKYHATYLELTNQSGKNHTLTHEVGESFSIRDKLAATMKEMNHPFQDGYSIEQLHEARKTPELPEVEGEVIEYEPDTTT